MIVAVVPLKNEIIAMSHSLFHDQIKDVWHCNDESIESNIMLLQSIRVYSSSIRKWLYSLNAVLFYFSYTDLGGSIGSAGAAYSPDGSMGYMMDGGQQFRTPGDIIIYLWWKIVN